MNEMDVPFVDKDTQTAVKGMDDMWLIVGPVRIAQHLSNVWHASEQPKRLDILSAHSPDHPLSKWAGTDFKNYSWLLFYGMDMCDEYVSRFKISPSIRVMLQKLEDAPEEMVEADWTEPPHV
jgi:hypothetical protein